VRQVPLLACLTADEAQGIAAALRHRRFAAREVIVERGEPGDSLYIVLSGRLNVVLTGSDGREVILSHVRAGDFFGEVALLDGGPRSGTVVGVEAGELLELGRDGFLRLLDREPRVAARLYRELCARLRHANEMIGDLALLDVYGRIAHVLVELAASAPRKDDNILLVPRPKLAEIAGRASTTEETVSRVLRRLHDTGAISLSRRALVIHNAERLRLP
jgi:CRP-like cAMP-binding protein